MKLRLGLRHRLPPLLAALILVNLTSHMALSGGRLSGSLYTLHSGAPEWVVGVYMALFASVPLLTSLWVGRWIDRAGARHVMRRGVVLLLLGAWLPALVLTVPMFFAMAMLLGFGFNLVSMSGLHAISSVSAGQSAAQRLGNFGWYGLGYASSAALGPALSGLLIDHLGFRASLIVMAGFSCCAALLVFTFLSRMEAGHSGASAPAPTQVAPAWHDLLAITPLRRVFVVGQCISSGWDLFVVLLPVLGTRLGFSASVIGLISSMFAFGNVVSRALTPWLAARFREWQNLRASALGITLVFLVLPWAAQPATLMLLGFAFGASVGLSQPNALSLLYNFTPPGRSGEALGLRAFLSNGSSVLMPLLFGLAVAPLGMAPLMWAGAALVGSSLPAAQRALRQQDN